jgi:uncharacterized membrane protein
MMRAAWIAALTVTGLFAGILVAGVLTAQAMATQQATVYATVARTTHLAYALPMLTVQLAAIASTTTLLVMLRRHGRRQLLTVGVALVCLLVVMATTLAINVPINGQMIDEWPVRIPSDWAQIRDRWNTWHAVRTTLGVIAFCCLVAIPLPPSSPGRRRQRRSAAAPARRAGTAGSARSRTTWFR